VGCGSETDNERYKQFLEYCEERRNNWARCEQEDTARMKEKKRKEEQEEIRNKGIEQRREKENEREDRRENTCVPG
jgi:hypothetical protein